MRMLRVAALWIILLVLAGATLYRNEPAPMLRIGSLKTVDSVIPAVEIDKGYFDDENITVGVSYFGTSTAMAEAMASGEIDAAYISIVPVAVWKERGADMVIVAGASRGGDVVCTKNGSATGKIAVSGKGTMTQIMYDGLVKSDTSYEPVYGIEPPDMPTALMITGDVDAALTAEPFASQIMRAGGRCDYDAGDQWEKAYGVKYQRNVLVVNSRVLNDTKLLAGLLRAHQKAVDYLNGPDSESEIEKVMSIAPLVKNRVEYNSSLDWPSMEHFWGTALDDGYIKSLPQREGIFYGG